MGRNAPESPGNAKKRRRTANSTSAPVPQSSPVPDLVPPPLSGYGDTVIASNPFDDAVPTSAPMRMRSMGLMGPSDMLPGGIGPVMPGQIRLGPGPIFHGPSGHMGPNGLHGNYGHGPGRPIEPGMPMCNAIEDDGVCPVSSMSPMMSVANVTGHMGTMNSSLNTMNTRMGDPMHGNVMGSDGGLMHSGVNGMCGRPIPTSSGKVYPPDQPMVFNPQNPNAPPIYPCGICHKEVHENDQAILCESGCNFWFHRMCTGLTEQAYRLLIDEVYAEWVCDRCLHTKNIPLIKFKP